MIEILQNPLCGETNFLKKYFISSINIKFLLQQVKKLLFFWEKKKYQERTIILAFSLNHAIQYQCIKPKNLN